MTDDIDPVDAPDDYRWDSWEQGSDVIVERGLMALDGLPGETRIARLEVLACAAGDAESERQVARHAIDRRRDDAGRAVASSLLRTATQRLVEPFEGTVVVRWTVGSASNSERIEVRVGTARHSDLDWWRRAARLYRDKSEREMEAVLDMFGASSSVIRAAGAAGNAIAGNVPQPAAPEPDPIGELLRHAEKAGVHEFVRQFLADAAAVDPEFRQSASAPSPDEEDDDASEEPALFDAWALVGVSSSPIEGGLDDPWE